MQNLRASCQTDWVEKYPSHVVAQWLGHSLKVAAQHYLMSRAHHFEDVVRGPHLPPSVATAAATDGTEAGDPCSAECCAPNVQNAVQQAPAPDRTNSHETTEPMPPLGLQRVLRKYARFWNRPAAGRRAKKARRGHGWPCGRKVAGTGFEPATSRL